MREIYPQIHDSNGGSNLKSCSLKVTKGDTEGEISPRIHDSNGGIDPQNPHICDLVDNKGEIHPQSHDSKGDKSIKGEKETLLDSNGEISRNLRPEKGHRLSPKSFRSDAINKVDTKGVKERIKAIERSTVQRNKVVLSPYKIKKKELSEKLSIKVKKYNENVLVKSDKNDKNVVNLSKKDKNVSFDKKEIKRINLIKDMLDENVSLKNELDSCCDTQDNVASKSTERMDTKNAFEVLLESAKGGKITNLTPKRRKRRIVSSTPTSSGSKNIVEWFKKN